MIWIAIWGAVAVVGLVGVAIGVQGLRFERRVARDARALAAQPPGAPAPLAPLAALPPPVQRYLEVSGAAARGPLRVVRVRHGGTLVMNPGGRPFPVRGRQLFSLDPPGFVWWGRVRVAPGVWVDGRDQVVAGRGNMLIRVASTFTVADARGRDLDEGALHRLLAEAVWMPTLLRDARHVTWAPLDASTARATLRVGDREVTADFHFGADGLPARITALRWLDQEGKGVLTPWTADCSGYREVSGVRVPFRITAAWQLATGPFPYGRWEVEAVELDPDGW
jgi:hypothetical protein